MKNLNKYGLCLFGIFALTTISWAQHQAQRPIVFQNSENNQQQRVEAQLADFFSNVKINHKIDNNCVTINNLQGQCVLIRDCRIFNQILNVDGVTKNVRAVDLIQRSICRIDKTSKQIYICCRLSRTLHRNANNDFISSNPSSNSESQNPGPFSRKEQFSKLPNEKECGLIPALSTGTRIFGGSPSEKFAWPWLAALGRPNGDKFNVYCGGTLITRLHVLSAAHCFKKSDSLQPTHVRLGEFDTASHEHNASPADFVIVRSKNPHFDARTFENDIAIVLLSKPVDYNYNIQPACLPSQHQQHVINDVTVVGWGKRNSRDKEHPRIPFQASSPVVNYNKCANAYNRDGTDYSIDHRNICTESYPVDTCTGDSGGPLHSLDQFTKKWRVVGIVSFGARCGDGRYPGVNINIKSYLPWIENNLDI